MPCVEDGDVAKKFGGRETLGDSVTVVRANLGRRLGEDVPVAAEIHMVVVVVGVVVVGCEDQGEDLLLPHVTGNVVQNFGFWTIKLGRPAPCLVLAVFPGGAVVPVFDEVKLFALVVPKGCDVDGSTQPMLAQTCGGAAVGSNGPTVVGAKVHDLCDATLLEILTELDDGQGQLTSHEHSNTFVGATDPIHPHDRRLEGEGVCDRASQVGETFGLGLRVFARDEVDAKVEQLLVARTRGFCRRAWQANVALHVAFSVTTHLLTMVSRAATSLGKEVEVTL